MPKKLTYADALNEALREEMERFPELFILGEDICRPDGEDGAFKITAGLHRLFPNRVKNTILNESSIVGNAIGTALAGGKAVAEMQFADFVTDAVKMIRNHMAGLYYRNGLPLSVVIRLPSGAIGSAGEFHSICPETMFFNVPGLIILAPSTPYEAKGLLKAAIRSSSPVIFLEWKRLYRMPIEKYPKELDIEIPDEDYVLPFGKARVVAGGNDLTIVSYGNMLFETLKARKALAEKGINAEIIDLRSIMPFDWQIIFESVKKTGRVIFAHEDKKIGSIGMTLAQMVSEELFDLLDAPPVVVGAPFTPIPHHPNLENAYLPNANDVVRAAMTKIFGERVPTRNEQHIAPETTDATPIIEECRADQRIEKVPFSPIQKIVARTMTLNALRPTISDYIDVDIRGIWHDREEKKGEFEKTFGIKLTLTHYFAYAVVKTLMRDEFWKFRSSVEEKTPSPATTTDVLDWLGSADTHLKKNFVNLSLAVDMPNHDLLVPVVKDAHKMLFFELACAIGDLVERCRNKKISPDELRDGNFTITNVGVFGTLAGDPILSPGQNATLAIGGARDINHNRVIVLTLAFDHRPINGAEAGLFKQALKEFLENWNVDIFSA